MPVINAHITGTVWKIEVKLGDVIEPGTVVAILESMKMEMPVESEEGGTCSWSPMFWTSRAYQPSADCPNTSTLPAW